MAEAAFWRRTPPALFPATLGLLGLALAWLRGVEALGAPAWIGAALLAAGGAFLAFALASYLAKILSRPAILMADIAPPPGRAAVSAGSMCLMVSAAALNALTGDAGAAAAVWWAGVALHGVYFLATARALMRTGRPSTTLYLPFVGYITASFAGPALGYGALSLWFYLFSLAMMAVVTAVAVPPFFRAPTPVPARASAAIPLAPLSLIGVSGAAVGLDWTVAPSVALALAALAVLLARVRWLTAGGFTPLWGAFTFPAAAFSALMLVAARRWGWGWEAPAWAALAAATAVIIPIWLLTIRAWAQGRLAPATGAQIA